MKRDLYAEVSTRSERPANFAFYFPRTREKVPIN
jgi:hypothetical protein